MEQNMNNEIILIQIAIVHAHTQLYSGCRQKSILIHIVETGK